MGKLVNLVVVVFFLVAVLIGPWCLSYDIYHISATFGNHTIDVSMWNPAVLICGVIFSSVTVPLALVIWLMVVCGVMV